jgi:hypothetical protein
VTVDGFGGFCPLSADALYFTLMMKSPPDGRVPVAATSRSFQVPIP